MAQNNLFDRKEFKWGWTLLKKVIHNVCKVISPLSPFLPDLLCTMHTHTYTHTHTHARTRAHAQGHRLALPHAEHNVLWRYVRCEERHVRHVPSPYVVCEHTPREGQHSHAKAAGPAARVIKCAGADEGCVLRVCTGKATCVHVLPH